MTCLLVIGHEHNKYTLTLPDPKEVNTLRFSRRVRRRAVHLALGSRDPPLPGSHPLPARASMPRWLCHAVTTTGTPNLRGHVLAHDPSHACRPCIPMCNVLVTVTVTSMRGHHAIPWGHARHSPTGGNEPITLDCRHLNNVFQTPPSGDRSSFSL